MKKKETLTKEDIEHLHKLFKFVRENLKESFKTLEEAYSDYFNYLSEGFAESYYRSHMTTYKHLIQFFNKDMLLSEITTKSADDFIQTIKASAPRGVNVYIRNLKAFFNKLIEWNYIEENPFEIVKKVRFQKEEEKVLTVDEFNTVFDHMYKNDPVRCIAAFAFYSGCRLSEVTNLKWKNIDFKNGTVTIGDGEYTTKTKTIRRIPLNIGMVLSIGPFYSTRNKYEYVFCKSNGFSFTGNHPSKKFKRAITELGLNNSIHFHSLRHSYASRLIRSGVSHGIISKLLGHSSISTTEKYTHIDIDTLINQLNGRL